MKGAWEYPHYEQVIAPGRGLELDGQILYDSPASGDSYDRAVTTGVYAALHHGFLKRVIFSGGHSFVHHANGVTPQGSEAAAMYCVALDHGLSDNVETVIDETATTTYANILNNAHYFRPGERVGMVVHSDHAERALNIGLKVAPNVIFEPIYADNAYRRTTAGSGISDMAARVIYGAAMGLVLAGNHDMLRRQDERVQRLVLSGLRLRSKLTS